jgi:hypothetical protein
MSLEMLPRGPREEGLPTVSGGEEPGDAVYRGSEVVAVALLYLPGVQRHPDPHPAPLVPGLGEDSPLGRERRFQGVWGGGEGRAAGVADHLEDVAAMGRDGGLHYLIVPSEG